MKKEVITGHEFAGEVVDTGRDCRFSKGDKVANLHRSFCNECRFCKEGNTVLCERSFVAYGTVSDGGYSQYAVCEESSLVSVPKEVSYQDASFINCTAAVALRGLRTQAKVRKGDRVLITGATGGVGVHACQVAKILGCYVIAGTTSPEKAERINLKAYCDEIVVFERNKPFHKKINPVDCVLDLVGRPTFNSSIRSLRRGGNIVLVGNVSLGLQELNLGLVIVMDLHIHGSTGATPGDLSDCFQWIKEGRLKPIVHKVFPLEEAEQAQKEIDKAVGRVVLDTTTNKKSRL